MSPTSSTIRPKRRRTALTLAGDIPPTAVPAVDHHPTEVPGSGGLYGTYKTKIVTGGEPAKRKQFAVGSKIPSAIPRASSYGQHGQGAVPLTLTSPKALVALNNRTNIELEGSTELQPAGVSHRPTYRADLAKRGYLVRNSLGCGSYSKVKKALNSRRNFELTAVKIVDRMRAPRDYQDKFMPRELALWPQLHHPNLIRFMDYFEDSSRVYMVLEYAEGGDALHYVQSTGALPEEQAKSWTVQMASAVAYMHELGIAHRDLKLENLLLSGDLSTVKICDFGFVRQVHNSIDEGDLSQTFCGSKAYAAPEILQGRPYDPMKADVWAIGVIIYILVTGKMPFDETKGTKSVVEEQQLLGLRWLLYRRPSATCQSLIRRSFTWDFLNRPTAHVVLNDRWLTEQPSLPTERTRPPTASDPITGNEGHRHGNQSTS